MVIQAEGFFLKSLGEADGIFRTSVYSWTSCCLALRSLIGHSFWQSLMLLLYGMFCLRWRHFFNKWWGLNVHNSSWHRCRYKCVCVCAWQYCLRCLCIQLIPGSLATTPLRHIPIVTLSWASEVFPLFISRMLKPSHLLPHLTRAAGSNRYGAASWKAFIFVEKIVDSADDMSHWYALGRLPQVDL